MNTRKIMKSIEKKIELSKLNKIASFLKLENFKLENDLDSLKGLLKAKKLYKNYENEFLYIEKIFKVKESVIKNNVYFNELKNKSDFKKNPHLKIFINEVLNSGLLLDDFIKLYSDFYQNSDKLSDLNLSVEMLKNDEIKSFVVESINNGKIKKLSSNNSSRILDNSIKTLTDIFQVVKRDDLKGYAGELKGSKYLRVSKKLFDKIANYNGESIKLSVIYTYNVAKEIELVD